MKILPLVFTALYCWFSAHFATAGSQKWEMKNLKIQADFGLPQQRVEFKLKDTFEFPEKISNTATWLSRSYEIINPPEKHSNFKSVFDTGLAPGFESTSPFHSAARLYPLNLSRYELQDRTSCFHFNFSRKGKHPANSKEIQNFFGVDECWEYFQSPEYKQIQFLRKGMPESVYKMNWSKLNHTFPTAREDLWRWLE